MKAGVVSVALDQHLFHLLEEIYERGIRLEEGRRELDEGVSDAGLLFPVDQQLSELAQHAFVRCVDVGQVAEDNLQLGVVEQRLFERHFLQMFHEHLIDQKPNTVAFYICVSCLFFWWLLKNLMQSP